MKRLLFITFTLTLTLPLCSCGEYSSIHYRCPANNIECGCEKVPGVQRYLRDLNGSTTYWVPCSKATEEADIDLCKKAGAL